MRQEPRELLLTTHEAAELLGVGPTSIKRWSDEGLLECLRTVGGHRRYRLEAVLALRNEGEAASEINRNDPWIDLLLHSGIQAVLGQLLIMKGRLGFWYKVAGALDHVIQTIGLCWERGEISIAEEHVISMKLARGISRAADIIPLSPDAPTAILAVAAGDLHTLGISLCELVLREVGVASIWIGERTPSTELVSAIEKTRPSLLALSASVYSQDTLDLLAQASAAGAAAGKAGTQLVMGGRGAWPDPPPYGLRLNGFTALSQIGQSLTRNKHPQTLNPS